MRTLPIVLAGAMAARILALEVPTLWGDGPGPRIAVDQAEYDFGTLDVGVTGEHEFVVTNTGTEPLRIARGKSSCGCCTCVCVAQVPETETIAPGQSAKVVLQWTSMLYTGPFRQSQTLLTNDPQRPEVTLAVWGRFGAPWRATPADLVFSRVLLAEPATAELCLFSYTDQPIGVTGWELADQATAGQFDVRVEPLSPEQLRQEPTAKSGCRVRVTVKPGLPRGPFQQRLVLKTTGPAAPSVEIPIRGEVASDLLILGQGWDPRTSELHLDKIDPRHGAKARLLVLVRGRYAKEVQLALDSPTPPWLRITVGPRVLSQDGLTNSTPVDITVSPSDVQGAPPGQGQVGTARVVLRTNHPLQPTLSFAVRTSNEP